MRLIPRPAALDSRFARKFALPLKAVGLLSGYAAWVLVFRLIVLTFVTYFVNQASAHGARFEEISEAFGANEITLMGVCAVIFVLFLRGLSPLERHAAGFEDLFSVPRIERGFLPGFLHGTVLGMGVILAFLMSGIYRFLGLFIQFDEAPLAIPSILVRFLAIGAWVYFEEFFFRRKVARHLKGYRPAFTVLFTSFAYCGIKMMQFDVGWMQLLTLFLASTALSLRAFADDDFAHGAGFWAALLIVFHPLLSLPIFGNEFAGVFLVKYQGDGTLGTLARLLTGGAGGPLSSFAFQFVLLLEILRGVIKYRKRLLTVPA